jgi:single-strand DNA-binding protein
MSRTLNKVMLIGNVGRDPELKFTPSGIPVTSFRLATSESWKDRDNKSLEHTDWHTVVAWRGLAEVIHKLVKKSSRVYIEGRIQTRSFDDKSGNRRHVVEILADNMLLLDQKKTRDDDDMSYQYDDGFESDFHIDSDFENKMFDESHRNEDIPF